MIMTMAKHGIHRRFGAGALIGALAGFVCLWASAPPAAAQSSEGRIRLAQGFFERLFGPLPGGGPFSPPEQQRPVDSSRAPPPHKSDTPPTVTIVVMGDSMADWLAYGLEDALSDTPEIGVIRKHRPGSGLIRYDAKNESLDWAQAAREILANEKPKAVVMMIGLGDRQAIRVREQANRAKTPSSDKPPTDQEQDNTDQLTIAAPEPDQRNRTPGVYEFHSEKWEELYTKRIDDTIAALKSKGVPVFWVGLPSLRTPKATSEASYLNELFRARADKAGIVYVDVWDGFVDERGAFTFQGPDYEGQNRRLRSSDGVYFTKPGARKLAHYLEREINRVSPLQAMPVALPEPSQKEPLRPGSPTARPLAGPAVPLAVSARAGEDLIGSASNRGEGESLIATHVLVKGESVTAPAGRADDFAWPRRGVAAFGTDPAVTTTTLPVPLAQVPPPVTVSAPPPKTAQRQAGGPLGPPQAPRAPPPRERGFNPFSFLPFFR